MRAFSTIVAIALSLVGIVTTKPVDTQDVFSAPDYTPASWGSRGVTFENCGSPHDPVQIASVAVFPNPPQPGKELTVKVKARVLETVEEGASADVTVKLGLIKLLTKSVDLCEEARKADLSVQCPVQPGYYEVEQKVVLPKEIPRAKFTINVNGYTVDWDELLCLKIVADFMLHPF
ncbi:Phosphatidylglycerol/phosphatidylinositol transfer protein [Leucoagaricus sp. SymC.cos]|nr:Phosphatidylglycerol/phosphatidylinositol transfer protein [Leucoagaricus sp. SymC.cos]